MNCDYHMAEHENKQMKCYTYHSHYVEGNCHQKYLEALWDLDFYGSCVTMSLSSSINNSFKGGLITMFRSFSDFVFERVQPSNHL